MGTPIEAPTADAIHFPAIFEHDQHGGPANPYVGAGLGIVLNALRSTTSGLTNPLTSDNIGAPQPPMPDGWNFNGRVDVLETSLQNTRNFITGLDPDGDWTERESTVRAALTTNADFYNPNYNNNSEIDEVIASIVGDTIGSAYGAITGTDDHEEYGALTQAESVANTAVDAALSDAETGSTALLAQGRDQSVLAGDETVTDATGDAVTIALSATLSKLESIQEDVADDVTSFDGDAQEQAIADIAALTTQITTSLSTAMTNAITAAEAAADHESITNARDAFEIRTRPKFMRGVNRYASQMAEGGAVNSSAFFVGMSILEAERGHEISNYDAELSHKMYQEAFRMYGSLLGEYFKSSLQGKIQELATRVEAYKSVLNEHSRAFITSLAESLKARVLALSEYMQTGRTISAQHSQVFQSAFASQIDAFKVSLQQHLSAYMAHRTQREQARLSLLNQAITEITQMELNKGLLTKDSAHLHGEMFRLMSVLYGEHYERNKTYWYDRTMFPVNKWQAYGNLLAAPSGASMIPGKPSVLQSTLGGVLAGAYSGAQIGSEIGASGRAMAGLAGLGGLMGGIGGLSPWLA